MAEPDNGNAPYRKPHNQGEHDEAQRFQRSEQDGPPAPRSTSHMFSEAAAVWPIKPEPGQPDPRPVWDPEDALSHISPLFAALRDICPDGTMLAEDRQALAYSLVHSFHLQAQRLTRSADNQKKALGHASRGELADEQSVNELEATLASYKDTASRAKAFERISSAASAAYKNNFAEVWAPAKSDFTVPGSPTVGRILTPSKVRKSRSYLSAQRTRPSALSRTRSQVRCPRPSLERLRRPGWSRALPALARRLAGTARPRRRLGHRRFPDRRLSRNAPPRSRFGRAPRSPAPRRHRHCHIPGQDRQQPFPRSKRRRARKAPRARANSFHSRPWVRWLGRRTRNPRPARNHHRSRTGHPRRRHPDARRDRARLLVAHELLPQADRAPFPRNRRPRCLARHADGRRLRLHRLPRRAPYALRDPCATTWSPPIPI